MGRKKQKKISLPSANLGTQQRLSLPSARSQGARQRILKKNKNLSRVPLGPALGKSSNLKAQNGPAQPHPLLTPLPPAPPRPCRAAAAPPSSPSSQRAPAGPAPAAPRPAPRRPRARAPSSPAPRPPCPAACQQREKERSKRKKEKGEEEEREGEEEEEERERGGGRRGRCRPDRPSILALFRPPVYPRAAAVIPAVVVGPRSCRSCRQGKPYPCRVSSSSS